MKKIIIATILTLTLILFGVGCTEATTVNHNLTLKAERFECERRITVYNARTDKIIFIAEGFLSITTNSTDELVVTFKVGDDEYKKNYVYLNDWTLYVVEDITGTHTDRYHYNFYFNTVLPSLEINP